jgi:hypothetical protein
MEKSRNESWCMVWLCLLPCNMVIAMAEVKFDDNAVVPVDKQGQPIGTRVFGPIPHEPRKKKHVKILTLAEHIA